MPLQVELTEAKNELLLRERCERIATGSNERTSRNNELFQTNGETSTEFNQEWCKFEQILF